MICLIATPSLFFFTRLSPGVGGQWKRGVGYVLGVGAKQGAASDKHAGETKTKNDSKASEGGAAETGCHSANL